MDLIQNAAILITISLVWVIIVYLGIKVKIGNQTIKDKRTLLGGLLLFVALVAIFFAVTAIYEHVESTEFCGTFCHVMEPFYESYINPGTNPMMSTHASYDISCGNCHNEPGIVGTIQGLSAALPEAYYYYTNNYDPDDLHGHVSREACLKCHDGKTASIPGSVTTIGETIIDPHQNDIACSDCHAAHSEEISGLTKDSCTICHGTHIEDFEEKLERHSNRAGSDCMDCHNRNHPEDARVSFTEYPSLITTEFCSDCHDGEFIRYSNNIHSYVKCIDCHSEHATLSIDFDICDKCHDLPNWHNFDLTGCLYCHNTSIIHSEIVYDPDSKDKPQIPTETCKDCHEGNAIIVTPGDVTTSIGTVTNPHKDDRECSDCHVYHHEGFSGLDKEACSICHGILINNFEEKLELHTTRAGETCMDCHDREHPSDAKIPFATYPSLINNEFCSDCHDVEYSAYISSFSPEAMELYGGNGCIDCHSEHRIIDAPHQTISPYDECINCHSNYNDPGSIHVRTEVSYLGVPSISSDFCKSCHEEQTSGYESGVHAYVNCITCHNDHGLIRIDFTACSKCHDPPTWHDTSLTTCVNCHDDLSIH